MPSILTDQERFPLLSSEQIRRLRFWREHPAAPRFNYACGDRLTAEGLDQVRAFERSLRRKPSLTKRQGTPSWLEEKTSRWLKTVPFYRSWNKGKNTFEELNPFTREELRRSPWAFVPDDQSLDELLVYRTTGTTGEAVNVLYHPVVPSMFLALVQRSLAGQGISLKGGEGVFMVLAGAQKSALTFVSAASFLNGSAYIKLNLNPADWRRSDDRGAYLDACRPEVISGDPVAFGELMSLQSSWRPKALINTSMTLLPGLRRALEEHFMCPVFDVYSMTECRPIGVSTGKEFEVTAPDLHVEIFDQRGTPCLPGRRGEVVVSGGRNPFLPILRYRTGDFAALKVTKEGRRFLIDLEGRAPVVFQGMDGGGINSIDVSRALKDIPLDRFSLFQDRSGALIFSVRDAGEYRDRISEALKELFGGRMKLTFQKLKEEQTRAGKATSYSVEPGLRPGPLWKGGA